ncbi:hypothetical protein V5799_005213 [Amblyomma americanum]|uniref:FP protein N-terminal domain-containing protein n=1 Tax=Amblyomma americanum TaxID=6943 RepID=A0AAQ4DZW6_AMBAM
MGDKPPGTIKDLLKYVNDQNADLRKEVEELKQSMTFMNDSFEAFRTTGEELEALKKEHAALKLEKDELAQTLAKTQKELIELKQYSRLSNVEIKGIPETEDESLVEVVQKIGEKIGMDVETTDIDVVHRVPTKEKTKKNVIVKFASRAARDKFLQSARKKRLSANDIGFSETTPVYLNEHLCPEYKAPITTMKLILLLDVVCPLRAS